MKTLAQRLTPFAFLASAGFLAACAPLGGTGLGSPQRNPTNQLLDMLDEATREGMSVVLVPALMPNKSVTDLSSYSHRVIFKNKDVPGIAYMQAFANNDLEKIKDAVYLWDFLEVNIVPPGTYLLSGGIDYRIDSTLAQVEAPKGQPKASPQGLVNLSAVLYRTFVKENYWRDAAYADNTYTQNVCNAVHVASGQCVGWSAQQYSQREKVSDGGWTEGTKIKDVPSIKLQAQIPDAHAPLSFTIQPGQILLSDRFHLKTPAVSYDRKSCRAVDTQNIQCALKDIQVYMRPAPMELTKKFIAREQPTLTETGRQVLARIQPMKTRILGEEGMQDLTWGLPVSLKRTGR
ncbi:MULTISPECIES: hypothetical protein [Pseudomonas aeruginosa group]|uniref:hypothetical protein n=1 Tax=Pseudomonas aeruginosa group TaxID=136841 RepID=UPI00210C9F76|nr:MULTISPECIES: hypothetical protein [Pseudomonas aeruginosa group]MCW8026915.1 hypothetical protein [Pseudomonas aeruginosa]MDY1576892.1 hypothetical protein [Pseudomonas paraeruginosa]UYT20293.1 lipoprotein, putative [Pseudomonas aeruginosa]HBO7422767.1 hypothetical protein [Pseudomonas aeruginosa]